MNPVHVWHNRRFASLRFLGLIAVLIFVISIPFAAWAQTLSVIHDFTGGLDGANPLAVTLDRQGNIYGNESSGYGSIYKLKRTGAAWIFTSLTTFQAGDATGGEPGAVTIGTNGTLYLANFAGGNFSGQC